MDITSTHQSGIISIKLLANSGKHRQKKSVKKLNKSETPRVEASHRETSIAEVVSEKSLSKKQINEFLLDDDDLDLSVEIEPKFNRLEIIINNILLLLFAGVARIIASIVSPSLAFSLLKCQHNKRTVRSRRDLVRSRYLKAARVK